VAVKRSVDESEEGEGFDGFDTEVGAENHNHAVMVSHRSPCLRFKKERSSCRAMLCRSWRSPAIEGQLLAK
jgi:hypothetical protein